MGVDLETIGAGFLSLFDHVMSLTWPVEFFYQSLGMGDAMVVLLPTVLLLYLVVYVICTISATTMHITQRKESVFNWKQKLANFFLTLLPFVTLQMLTGTVSEMGAAAATLGVTVTELLNAGVRNFFVYLGELFIVVGWWRIVLFVVFLGSVVYPWSQVLKCIGGYDQPGVGAIWAVFDVGLGFACAACLLLGMYYGKLILYLGIPALLLVNYLCRRKDRTPEKKKTAEIYTTS